MSDPIPVVHLVDDDARFRQAVSRLLSIAGYAVHQYASGGAFLLADVDRAVPSCILLDVRMPGPSGIELHEALAARGESIPVIFLTGHGDVPMSVRAMKAGAADFLTKPVERGVLLSTVSAAVERHRALGVRDEGDRALLARYETLTDRERDVLKGVVAGLLNKQVADRLGIAERTVKLHRANVMEKLGAKTLADLVRMAMRLPVGPGAR